MARNAAPATGVRLSARLLLVGACSACAGVATPGCAGKSSRAPAGTGTTRGVASSTGVTTAPASGTGATGGAATTPTSGGAGTPTGSTGSGGGAVSTSTTSGVDAGGGAGQAAGTTGGNVGLADVQEDFESSDTLQSPGLWMGTGIESTLPLESPEEPISDSVLAFHIAGSAGPEGADVMWHTAFPVESGYREVTFWARTDLAGGLSLRVTVGGPYAAYWEHVADGSAWPAEEFLLTSEWQQFRVNFDTLGFGPEGELSPYSSPFGAVHFVMLSDAPYDLWLDDVVFVGRTGG